MEESLRQVLLAAAHAVFTGLVCRQELGFEAFSSLYLRVGDGREPEGMAMPPSSSGSSPSDHLCAL